MTPSSAGPSSTPWGRFMASVEARRAARRDLRKIAREVHLTEQATNAIHSTVARWEDCWDCACTVLAETRAALKMPRYPAPDVPCKAEGCDHPSRFVGNNPEQPEHLCECHSWNLTYPQMNGTTICHRLGRLPVEKGSQTPSGDPS